VRFTRAHRNDVKKPNRVAIGHADDASRHDPLSCGSTERRRYNGREEDLPGNGYRSLSEVQKEWFASERR